MDQERENPRELPPGWAWATLEELVPLEYGKALPKRKRAISGTVPVYGSAGKIGTHSEALTDGPSIIVGRKGTAGAVYFSDEPSWPIDTAYFSRIDDNLDGRFAYHLLCHKALARLDQSTAIPSLSRDIYNVVRVAFPPLAEQHRIAEKIEELFGEIEAGEQELEKAREGLAAYRRALLKAAVTGDLTRDWREKNKPHETGIELLARIVAERGADHGVDSQLGADALPAGWTWTTLGQLSNLITSGSRGWKQYYATEGKVFIRAQNLKHDRLSLDDVAYVSLPDGAEGTRTRVKLGDILVTITGANVTKSGQVDIDPGEAYVNQHVGLVRPAIQEISDFVFLVIISPTHGRRQLEQAAYGAGKPGLALNDLAAVRIPLPPLDEQVEICNRVKTTFAALGDTFETIRHASRTGTACRSAILTAAFRGELIAQDPRDESASVLLERLRSAKALDVEEDNQRPADGKAKPAIASRRRIRKSSETVEGSAA